MNKSHTDYYFLCCATPVTFVLLSTHNPMLWRSLGTRVVKGWNISGKFPKSVQNSQKVSNSRKVSKIPRKFLKCTGNVPTFCNPIGNQTTLEPIGLAVSGNNYNDVWRIVWKSISYLIWSKHWYLLETGPVWLVCILMQTCIRSSPLLWDAAIVLSSMRLWLVFAFSAALHNSCVCYFL